MLITAMILSGVPQADAMAALPTDPALVAAKTKLGINRRVEAFELLVRLWAAILDQSDDSRTPLASRVMLEDIKARVHHHFPKVNEGITDFMQVVFVLVPLLRCGMSRDAFFDAWPDLPPRWLFAIRENFVAAPPQSL